MPDILAFLLATLAVRPRVLPLRGLVDVSQQFRAAGDLVDDLRVRADDRVQLHERVLGVSVQPHVLVGQA